MSLHPYALISRWGEPHTMGYYILHEGPIGVLDGKLHEINYKTLREDGNVELPSTGGWLGIGDKYWLTDPDGVAWEQFHTLDSIPTFSETKKAAPEGAACCAGDAPRGKPVAIPVKSACC